MSNFKEIFETNKKIAIIGLSPDPSKDSHKIGKYMQEAGYKIFPIHPSGGEILGEKVFRSLAEIEEEIDMVNVFRRSEFVAEIWENIKRRIEEKGDIKTVWLQIGVMDNTVRDEAEKMGANFIQNRCLMVEHLKYKGIY